MAASLKPGEDFKSSLKVIKADLLIPGRGEPIQHGAVVYEDKRILYVGKQETLPQEHGDAEVFRVPVVMPGMWDCHVHFLGSDRMALEAFYRVPQALAGAKGARDIAAVLNAGFTSVREVAGYGIHLAQAIEANCLEGPNIYSAGSIISPTGGHADAHDVPLEAFQDAVCHGLPMQLCDGVGDCLKAVRLQLRRGAKVIKLCTSGGVASERDSPHQQQFSDAELEALVGEARRANRAVAAHCHGKAGIMAALRAGVTTIEHGSYLDSECIEQMCKQGTILVATRTIAEVGLELNNAWTPESFKKLREVGTAGRDAYRRAIQAGVKLALGTDIGISVPGSLLNHGKNGMELKLAVEAGLSPLQAIEAATASGPATLGPQAPRSGLLQEGYDADFIALSRNPLEDIEVLTETTNITHVWRGGRLVKAPGRPVGFPNMTD